MARGTANPEDPTIVLDASRPLAHPGPPEEADRTRQLDPVGTRRPVIDRAGDALARQPRELWRRYQRLEQHQRGVVAALVALGIFLVLVALLS